jgi:hypothetical protein
MKIEIGVVYVLANEAMPGLLKIGFTTETAEARAIELSRHTGVPTAFKVAWSSERVSNPQQVEKQAHTQLSMFRENSQREFFRVELPFAIEVLEELAGPEHKRAREETLLRQQEEEVRRVERLRLQVQQDVKRVVLERSRVQFSQRQKEQEEGCLPISVALVLAFVFEKNESNTWYWPLLGFAIYWVAKEYKRPTYEPPFIKLQGDALIFRCSNCDRRVMINTRFIADIGNVNSFCPRCRTQLA